MARPLDDSGGAFRRNASLHSLFRSGTENRPRAGWRLLGYHLLLTLLLIDLVEFATAPHRTLLTQNGLLLLGALTGIVAFGAVAWLASGWISALSHAWWGQFTFGAALGAFLMSLVFLGELALGYVRVIQVGSVWCPIRTRCAGFLSG